jgi:hypothetical protein
MKLFLTLILLFISVRTFSHVGACTTPNHPGIGCMQTSSDFIQAIEAAKEFCSGESVWTDGPCQPGEQGSCEFINATVTYQIFYYDFEATSLAGIKGGCEREGGAWK